MTADRPTVVAGSIGFRSAGLGVGDWELGPVYRYPAQLVDAGPSPRVYVIGTAGGDDAATLLSAYAAFGRRDLGSRRHHRLLRLAVAAGHRRPGVPVLRVRAHHDAEEQRRPALR